MNKTVSMIGAGSFGTAMSTLLAQNNYNVNLWCYDRKAYDSIKHKRENEKYLPGIQLNTKIEPFLNLQEALANSQYIFQAVPVKYLRSVFDEVEKYISNDQIIVTLSKGIEEGTLFLPSQIISHILGNKIKIAVMSGPNFAHEIARNFYSVTTIASQDENVLKELKQILSNEFFKPIISKDIIGTQIGGAIKNIIALAIGLIQNSTSKSNQNAKAFILTQALNEMAQISECFGGKKETVYQNSGLGDLILTTTGQLSRNLKAGELLSKGKTLKDLDLEFDTLPEGLNTVISIFNLIQKCKLDLPICLETYQTIFENQKVQDMVKDIFKAC
ncbi:NAD(P)H-dependent glycerol-3-phosphate dehydrogenase [Candidatus Dependentiae bacterium]|nr:NAD(P)H-dependent glycerol-3-phosphate dehydrogenase [Candidatus Dependentiae bacterium]